MKFRLKSIFSVAVLALLLAITPNIVLAHEGEDHTQDEIAQTTTTDSEESEQTAQEQLKARLEARKTQLKTRLDAAKQARITSRCKASQGKLSSISGRIKGLETSRTQVYENLLSRLNKLSEKLATRGIDVAGLNTQITELTALITTFNTELAEYKQTVADLADMDCAADPPAFQASLEAARTARTETAEAAKAVRAYLKDTIKPTLGELKAQLGDKTEAEGTE